MMNSRSLMNRPYQQQQQQQQQQNGLRNDYQSVVQGIQSMMMISYQGVQIAIFGSLLAEKTKKLIDFIKSGAHSLITKLFTLFRIKQILKGQINIAQPVQGSMLKVLRFLLMIVIILSGVLLKHMYNKINEKKIIEAQNQQIEKQEQKDLQEQENQEQNQNENQSIQQNDFWNHPQIEENANADAQQQQQQQQIQAPQINYLNDLPGFSSVISASTAATRKPWMQ